jgi:hypothetical protein
MDRLFSDPSSGVRMLLRYPALSLGAVLTPGVGIGLSMGIFSKDEPEPVDWFLPSS